MHSEAKRILVVDDDNSVRCFVATVLRSAGYEVVECRTGVEAISLIAQAATSFDLVLADVMMPQLGGRQLAIQLTQLQPNASVLLMSGYPSLSSALNTMTGRTESTEVQYHFIAKPFTPKELIREVRRLLPPPDSLGPCAAETPVDLDETQLLSH